MPESNTASDSLPEPTGGFVWRQASWGRVLECSALTPYAPHCFTGRDLAPGKGAETDTAWAAVARYLGVSAASLHRLNQVHGCHTLTVDTNPNVASVQPSADAIATNRDDVGLVVKVADCVPILLADMRGRGVAAVHAGWRGTAQRIVMAAVGTLQRQLGAELASLVAAIGPSIGACCYEVGPEVRASFEHASTPDAGGSAQLNPDRWFEPGQGDRLQLDLWRANRDQLEAAGVPAASIHVAGLCTACCLQQFFSYRREGSRAGRMLAAIRRR